MLFANNVTWIFLNELELRFNIEIPFLVEIHISFFFLEYSISLISSFTKELVFSLNT